MFHHHGEDVYTTCEIIDTVVVVDEVSGHHRSLCCLGQVVCTVDGATKAVCDIIEAKKIIRNISHNGEGVCTTINAIKDTGLLTTPTIA